MVEKSKKPHEGRQANTSVDRRYLGTSSSGVCGAEIYGVKLIIISTKLITLLKLASRMIYNVCEVRNEIKTMEIYVVSFPHTHF